ncbi:6-phosphofructokinase [Parageobacillus sp. KH3-4]|uniref:6-phosphofructokinase n=1 Tax=Parageobacillus sp. KH3-4 TaxID=2916802 RepID=UPI001FCAF085|nr:6-phosphofructokinase [Parageobacillus sp. KH3-4]BDG47254.1 ATP-dependent 6-phosphofructokinase [Parageobacillus sp. KH3-4]
MKIGIITSGGDAPGMNAVLYHLWARLSKDHHITFYKNGVAGLFNGEIVQLTADDLYSNLRAGGTIIGTSRVKDEEFRAKLKTFAPEIDVLIVLGGDGSLRYICRELNQYVSVIGIPCTIDNDVPGTDYSIGFDSACNFYLTMYDYLLKTGTSLRERIFILETLGGSTGFLATAVGSSLNADIVLIPELPFKTIEVAAKLERVVCSKGFAIAVVSEGIESEKTVHQLEEFCNHRIRFCRPGHIARGCTPTFRDIEMARRFSEYVEKSINERNFGISVVKQGNNFSHLSFETLNLLPHKIPEITENVQRGEYN